MTQSPPPAAGATAAPANLGVIEAMRMAWRLLMADFWMLWLLAFVKGAVALGVGLATCCLCCLAPLVGFFVQPPLMAGLFRGVARRVDGGRVEVGDLFAAFPMCYWSTVLAGLPVVAIDALAAIVQNVGQTCVRVPLQIAAPLADEMGASDEETVLVILGIVAVGGLVALLATAVALALAAARFFFQFALLAVWDTPQSGVEALKTAVGFVRTRFWSVIGLAVLFTLLEIAAGIVGLLACCVGLLITVPAVTVWYYITMVYLYRSWTGQPLVQPIAAAGPEADAADGGAPVPPADVLPPDV
ncbi:MAG TPA: hypothetical protein VM238_14830 [Phycisphaerae bacterium]|nr:hypothetical protein [Phycisphaerae bacterium]